MEFNRLDNAKLYDSFNVRFNPNFSFHVGFPNEHSPLVAVCFVCAGRWDDAITLMKEMSATASFRLGHSEPILKRDDFITYMILKEPEVCYWHLGDLPEHFYTDPKASELVFAFYGSIEKRLRSTLFSERQVVNLTKFILQQMNLKLYFLNWILSLTLFSSNI